MRIISVSFGYGKCFQRLHVTWNSFDHNLNGVKSKAKILREVKVILFPLWIVSYDDIVFEGGFDQVREVPPLFDS